MNPVTVLLVDDHSVVRDGLRYILHTVPGIRVVAEASTGAEAITAVGVHHPDVVLMDLRMPEMDGIEATRRIKEHYPQTSIVIMTMQEDPVSVIDSLQAGVTGYLLKNARRESICQAVEEAALGEGTVKVSLLHPALKMGMDPSGSKQGRRPLDVCLNGEQLTERESEVLALLTEGRTNKEIGCQLNISPGTVKKHVENVLAKLGARDRTAAATIAVRKGLVSWGSES